MNVLEKILATKREEVEEAKVRVSPEAMAERAALRSDPLRGFRSALSSGPRPRVIAEIKRRSPSRGEIRSDFDPAAIAAAYGAAGAAALSVLTDESYFGGDLAFLEIARKAVDVPVLRKDFTVDPYQIDEARAHGADAVLLIVAAFGGTGGEDRLTALQAHARGLGLGVLVEVHDEAELEVAVAIEADLIGVNNRNLGTFEVDLATTERLAPRVPAGVVLVAESGIFHPEDIRRLEQVGASAFLVGESLMRQPDVGLALEELRRNP